MITHTSSGDPIPAGCEIGTFTVSENENTHTISHSLGEIPKFAVCLCVPNTAYANMTAGTIIFEDLAKNPTTGDFDRTYDANHRRNEVVSIGNPTNDPYFQGTATYTTYPASMTSTEVTFATGQYYNGQFKNGYTYIYILTK